MRTVCIDADFESWRTAARELLEARVHPDELLWSDEPADAGLFGPESGQTSAGQGSAKVPAAFLSLARSAAAHTDTRRWAVLYRLLWRVTRDDGRHLLSLPTDPDVRLIQSWCKAVGRDIHKMHAFVRFRLTGRDEESGREQFVAWYEPNYRIVRLASPFFLKRFTGMDWSILTPYECLHWQGEQLYYTPGVPRSAAPDDDALDDLWRSYYRSIFNPARLKVKAMQSEMPKKFWKNLPEAEIIGELISESKAKVQGMLAAEARPVKAAPKNAYLERLRLLNEEPGNGPQQ